MSKYKWDVMQYFVMINVILFFVTSLILPYEMGNDGSYYYGAGSVIRWCIFIFSTSLALHTWGIESHSFKGKTVGLGVVFVGDSYLKMFFVDDNGSFFWGYFTLYVLTFLLLIGSLYLDRFLYSIERR